MTKKVYHYTPIRKLIEILMSRYILTADLGIDDKEVPVVWFTTSYKWEATANKNALDENRNLIFLNASQTESIYGWARIQVKPQVAPSVWSTFKRRSGITKATSLRLERIAKAKGSDPREFRVSFNNVYPSDWLDIELYSNGFWISVLDGLRTYLIASSGNSMTYEEGKDLLASAVEQANQDSKYDPLTIKNLLERIRQQQSGIAVISTK